jgi:glycerol-3-phosphate O-acyltransferase
MSNLAAGMVGEPPKAKGNIESLKLYKGLGQLGRAYINFANPINLKEYSNSESAFDLTNKVRDSLASNCKVNLNMLVCTILLQSDNCHFLLKQDNEKHRITLRSLYNAESTDLILGC